MQSRHHQPEQRSTAAGRGDYLTWYLPCPWCHNRAPGPFLIDASLRLARHAWESHRYELSMFDIALSQVRRDEEAA